MDRSEGIALNGICPYFTMFPIEFPLNILSKSAQKGDTVLDPFCGRGTTNFAARLCGVQSLGVDSSPVAAAITASKLVAVSADEVIREAGAILAGAAANQIPNGEFWRWAFHDTVLTALCKLREALLEDCSSTSRIALRGVVLGALHGPKQKTFPSYLSNQCPRTYAPKPAYATQFWKDRGLVPEPVDVLAVIERRARRYYTALPPTFGMVRLADSRHPESLKPAAARTRFRWVITSPPYYGMKTYIPDQWLRNWFVGGPDSVDYKTRDQIVHSSPDDFSDDLKRVWKNAAGVCRSNAKMIVRFGGISDRRASPLEVIKHSFEDSGWRISTIKRAGSATEGKRQADSFLRASSRPLDEYDVWAQRH